MGGAKSKESPIDFINVKKTAHFINNFNKYALHEFEDQKFITNTDFENEVFNNHKLLGRQLFVNYAQSQLGLNKSDYVKLCFDVDDLNAGNYLLFFASLYSSDKIVLNQNDIMLFFESCMNSSSSQLDIDSSQSFNKDDLFLKAFVKCIFTSEGDLTIEIDKFVLWTYKHIPYLTVDLYHLLLSKFSLNEEFSDIKNLIISNNFTSLLEECNHNHSLISTTGLWLLSCILPPSYYSELKSHYKSNLLNIVDIDGWHCLFNSLKHGLSTSVFLNKISNYNGPTLLFLSSEDQLFLIGLDQEWKEGNDLNGKMDCFLAYLYPEFKIIHKGENMIYFNINNKFLPKCVKYGRNAKTYWLSLDPDLTKLEYMSVEYKIKSIEVWGCGGKSALEKYKGQKEWEKMDILKIKDRKPIKENWKDNVDRQLFEMIGRDTSHNQRNDI